MKRVFPRDDDRTRFRGPLRHYHRAETSSQRSWDAWVDGDRAKPGRSLKVLKAIGIALALLALAGIIAGLIIELR